ncbi:MAG: hypothetical protein KDD60_02640 [Bdellovibrionales bacterium]|nr:hypothetical protein [Bdellovibrionales bacterium]
MTQINAPLTPPCTNPMVRTLIDAKHLWASAIKEVREQTRASRSKAAGRLFRARKRLNSLKKAEGREWQRIVKRDSHLYLNTMYRGAIQDVQGTALTIALEICRKFLKQELSSLPTLLHESIIAHLHELSETRPNRICIHSSFVTELQKSLQSYTMHIALEVDDDIEPGKARIDTSHGSVLIDWEENFSQLARKLHSQLLDQWSHDAKSHNRN